MNLLIISRCLQQRFIRFFAERQILSDIEIRRLTGFFLLSQKLQKAVEFFIIKIVSFALSCTWAYQATFQDKSGCLGDTTNNLLYQRRIHVQCIQTTVYHLTPIPVRDNESNRLSHTIAYIYCKHCRQYFVRYVFKYQCGFVIKKRTAVTLFCQMEYKLKKILQHHRLMLISTNSTKSFEQFCV